MSSNKSDLWEFKYQPKTLAEYKFHDKGLENAVRGWIKDGIVPQLLLTGVQGSGKSALSELLVTELNMDSMDVLEINASNENDVDTMRTKIHSFISTYAMGKFKVVRLEEADRLSQGAQDILRGMMNDYVDVARFIMTGNHENRINPQLKSRMHHYRFSKPDRDDITEYAASILLNEKVKFTIDLLDKYVAIGYPDIRKIVVLLQQNTHEGILQSPEERGEAGDYKFALLELVETGNWLEARKLACAQVSREEWEDVFRFLYENLDKSPSFSTKDKWEAGIVIIADHLYKHGICADPEINAAAMFIRLEQV